VQAGKLAQRELCQGWAVAEKAERIRGVPRGEEIFVSEGKKALDAARGARGMPVTLATRPERFVVEKPPSEPDYPRYQVEPGTASGSRM
jgi:lipoprotein-anchoring transpeptidase ErfK/SrfK